VKIEIKNKLDGKQKFSIGELNWNESSFNKKKKTNQKNEGQIEKNKTT
jgi:hypothetical protein